MCVNGCVYQIYSFYISIAIFYLLLFVTQIMIYFNIYNKREFFIIFVCCIGSHSSDSHGIHENNIEAFTINEWRHII